MKAAMLHELKRPLTIEEVVQPKPAAHEVLIEVQACGVCHSDLHVANGDWPQIVPITKTPLILGHEIAGRIVEKGASVNDLEVGDRVGVPWVHWTCGECEFCREGNENLCAKQQITGVTVDGGYAEFVKAPSSHALKIPDGLTCVEAAPLFCAGVTVYRALRRAKIQPGLFGGESFAAARRAWLRRRCLVDPGAAAVTINADGREIDDCAQPLRVSQSVAAGAQHRIAILVGRN